MKQISIDNGRSYITAVEAMDQLASPDTCITWDNLVSYMDDETREAVHAELAPCSEVEFLTRYLELAPADLIIG